MKTGDIIRVVKIPANLHNKDDLQTKTLFELCLGRCFPIAGTEDGFVRLDVGEVTGQRAYMQTIWIEPEYVELVEISD